MEKVSAMQKYAVELTALYGDNDPRERKTHPMWERVYLASEVEAMIQTHVRHADKMMWFPACPICQAERVADSAGESK